MVCRSLTALYASGAGMGSGTGSKMGYSTPYLLSDSRNPKTSQVVLFVFPYDMTSSIDFGDLSHGFSSGKW